MLARSRKQHFAVGERDGNVLVYQPQKISQKYHTGVEKRVKNGEKYAGKEWGEGKGSRSRGLREKVSDAPSEIW